MRGEKTLPNIFEFSLSLLDRESLARRLDNQAECLMKRALEITTHSNGQEL